MRGAARLAGNRRLLSVFYRRLFRGGSALLIKARPPSTSLYVLPMGLHLHSSLSCVSHAKILNSQSWQKKLTSLGVAQFPWDPPPPQSAPQSQNQILPPTATVPSNAPRPAASSASQQQHVSHQSIPQSVPGTVPPLQAPTAANVMNQQQSPQIKTEPGMNGQSGYPPINDSQAARERAANLLQMRFGPAANNSVNSLHAQTQSPSQVPLTMPGQQRPQNPQQQPSNGQMPQVKQEPGYPPMSQTFLGNAQSDGASDAMADWKAEVARRREAAQRQPGQNDRLLREHLRQRMLEMEGGGLLVPLEERQQSSSSATSRKLATDLAKLDLSSSSSPSQPPTTRAQFDGPGGDDEKVEDDEDAINSDLDDPEDHEAEENDAEDAVGQVMLCTYDKVQRVKNKWKCTLKDGILTTGGKE